VAAAQRENTAMAEYKSTSVDLTGEALQWNSPNNYADFLNLDTLLRLQEPQWAGKHDEVMFVVVHQVSELWFKLILHELTHLRGLIHADDLDEAEPTFERIRRIQTQLIASWDVTVTLDPAKYLEFRETNTFQGSSGFQSHQYRMLEFILGNKNQRMIDAHKARPQVYQAMLDVLGKPSLYDEALRLLHRHGLEIPTAALERDWSLPYSPCAEVEQAWLEVYRNHRQYRPLYRFAERLIDIEYQFQKWRYTHMKTVERLIGFRPGTGGSQGVGYLMKALDITFFPELWSVRSRFVDPPSA
jgi:tryptophan 2,3-dioxygenase